MKKVLLGLVIAVMITKNVSAEIRFIEEGKPEMTGGDSIYVSTVCVDGYKFVIAHRTRHSDSDNRIPSTTNDITQHFSIQDGINLPTKC